jgi:hypothetical protein
MCYGCNNGSAGNENKHGLPPDGMKHIKSIDNSETQLLFGDIFILMKQKSLCDFDTYDYGLFYSIQFDDNVSDDDNVSYYSISDDNSEQNEEYIVDSDELGEDTNEY